ncbi:hypothetical protein [Ottowia sp.]|uniref:hypothetical protein n=1 Tax=Ottowia sp. TaxID=1898956 RepID=UPI003A85A431
MQTPSELDCLGWQIAVHAANALRAAQVIEDQMPGLMGAVDSLALMRGALDSVARALAAAQYDAARVSAIAKGQIQT